jgi:cell division protein FtsI (penicillin-binding protein 3)/stage V sporulation protein D (sporulation-specific penicillin-binding protein)
MSKGFASNYRIVVLAAGIFLCFGGVGVRLLFLHVIDRDQLVRYIDKARRQVIEEKARRGDILDARGNVLATSHTLVVVGVDPQMLRKEDETKWPALASLLNLPLAELKKTFSTKTRPTQADDDSSDAEVDIRWAKLSEDITEKTYESITALGVKGVYGERTYRRAYPHNQLAAHVIGFVNKEGAPASGIEHFADFYLRGQDGWRESEKDGRQRELAQFRTREVPATDGYSVVLSIDSAIQHIVECELDELAKKYSPEKMTIIVSDPHTGFILAMGNYPTFNLNEYSKADLAAQRNIAVADMYEPGSTFKIVAASGALNDGLVTPESPRFDCSVDRIDYKGKTRGLPREDHHFAAPLNTAEIIGHSSNRGAAQLAMLLGDERFYNYARAFGFGQLTGFPVGGEIDGQMAPPAKWDGLTITRMPMGQSVAATPIQMHMAMSVVASGGLLMRPQIIREVRDAKGERVYRFDGVSRSRAISEHTAETMAYLLMRVASSEGTAPEAAIPGFQVAGKTGTAQKLVPVTDSKGRTVLRYSEKDHVASFVGFFPASRPQISITVIIDGADARCPGGVAYGAKVAAPSFKRIGEQLIQYLDIKPVTELNRPLLVMGGGKL